LSEAITDAAEGKGGAERRAERRIRVRLPICVTGTDRGGAKFEERTTSENICRGGLAFVLSRELDLDVDVEIQIPEPRKGQGPFATRGRVRHIETKEAGLVIGVQFTGPRYNHVFVSESVRPD
jgi:hypothetical protein